MLKIQTFLSIKSIDNSKVSTFLYCKMLTASLRASSALGALQALWLLHSFSAGPLINSLLHCLMTQINIFMTCKHYLLCFSRQDGFEFPLRQQGMTLETHQEATPSLAPTHTQFDQPLHNGWLQQTLHILIQQPLHHRWA